MVYYGVFKGKKTGIFTTWSDCEDSIKGFSGAIYKKFNHKEDADFFVKNGYEQVHKNILSFFKEKQEVSKIDTLDVQTYGYSNETFTGYGIFVPSKNLEYSFPLTEQKTVHIASLQAIIKVIELFSEYKLNIYTNSDYCIQLYYTTGIRYQSTNFIDKGNKIPNYDLVSKLIECKSNDIQILKLENTSKVQQLAILGSIKDTDISNYILTFGKYKNKRLSEVPENYLEWLVTNNINCKEIVKYYLNTKN